MLKDLPRFIDPLHLAKQGCTLQGRVALSQMPRLHDKLCQVQGDVLIDWQFANDGQQRPTIVGSLQTQLKMLCQRCLQPMDWPIDAKVALMVIPNEQAEEELPEDFEALTLTSIPISLLSLIEDELILALPIVVKHPACQVVNEYPQGNGEQYHPFQALSQWKKTNG